MALATRPKTNTHHRKRQGQHHHHGKSYLRTYWPYLPMLAIIWGGVLANRAMQNSSLLNSNAGAVIGAQHAPAFGASSRLQSLLGYEPSWIFLAVLGVTAVTFTLFVVSHWYRFHRLINKGEAFIIQHPWLEIGVVFLFTVGFVLTRAGGGPS